MLMSDGDPLLDSRVVLQQNERFSDLENKYTLLHQRTTGLLTLEEDVLRVSEKVGIVSYLPPGTRISSPYMGGPCFRTFPTCREGRFP